MKKLLLGLAALCLSLTSFSADIQIANNTDEVVKVRIGINDGTDCVADSWIDVCVAANSTHIATTTGTPFTVRVWEAPSCVIVASTESWQHNLTWTSCADAPTSEASPYTMAWNFHMGSWGITIED